MTSYFKRNILDLNYVQVYLYVKSERISPRRVFRDKMAFSPLSHCQQLVVFTSPYLVGIHSDSRRRPTIDRWRIARTFVTDKSLAKRPGKKRAHSLTIALWRRSFCRSLFGHIQLNVDMFLCALQCAWLASLLY